MLQLRPVQQERQSLERQATEARLGEARTRADLLESQARQRAGQALAASLRDEHTARAKLEREFEEARSAAAEVLERLNHETATHASRMASLETLHAQRAGLEEDIVAARARNAQLRDAAATGAAPVDFEAVHRQHALAAGARLAQARLRADLLQGDAELRSLRDMQGEQSRQADTMLGLALATATEPGADIAPAASGGRDGQAQVSATTPEAGAVADMPVVDAHALEEAREARAVLAAEHGALTEQIALLEQQYADRQETIAALRATLDDVDTRAWTLEDESSRAADSLQEASAALEQLRADTGRAQEEAARLRDEAARIQADADAARAAHEQGRERMREVQRQNAELEEERIRTLVQIKATKARMQEAQREADSLEQRPARRPRFGVAGIVAAFAAVAAAVYLVPRYLPAPDAPTSAPATAAKAGAPAVSAAAPLYGDDQSAQRDLNLSYEMRPAAPGAAARK
jgi:chromosome segregation ATPase